MVHDGEYERSVALRIIDANANRCAEGLRVVEEIARFDLAAEDLQRRLKDLRHAVRRAASPAGAAEGGALAHRESDRDVGSRYSTGAETARGSLAGIARASFARAEEALRVLEEFSKLVLPGGGKEFKRLRFDLYTIEKDFFGGAERPPKLPRAPFLYGVLDRAAAAGRDIGALARDLAAGGCGMIQYRAKNASRAAMRDDISAAAPAAWEAGIPLIVNDDPELALEAGAAGVHLGSADAPAAEARDILGPDRIIGVSIESIEDLPRAAEGAVDYVAVGAVFPTPTKPDARIVGVDLVRLVRGRTRLPLVAIGGITPANCESVLDAGADGVAVVSALLAGDVRKNSFTFMEIIDRRRGVST